MGTQSETISHRSELSMVVAPGGRIPSWTVCVFLEEQEGVGDKNSAVRNRSVDSAAADSAWPSQGWRVLQGEPKTHRELHVQVGTQWTSFLESTLSMRCAATNRSVYNVPPSRFCGREWGRGEGESQLYLVVKNQLYLVSHSLIKIYSVESISPVSG